MRLGISFKNKKIDWAWTAKAVGWLSTDKSIPFARKLDETHESIVGVSLVKEFPHAKVFEVVAEPKEFKFD